MADNELDPLAKRMVGSDGTPNLPGEEMVIVPGESLVSRADELSSLLRGLQNSISALEVKIDETDKRAMKSFDRATISEKTAGSARRSALIVALLLFVVIGFIAILSTIAFSNRSNIARLDTNQQRIDLVTYRGLCRINSLFLGSYSEAGRASSPQGPEAYDRAFEDLRQISRELDCP